VGLRRGEADEFVVDEDGRDHRDVVEVRAAVVVVQQDDVARREVVGPELLEDVGDAELQRAEEAGNAVGLREDVGVRVGDPAGVVERLVDDAGLGGATEVEEHLLGGGAL